MPGTHRSGAEPGLPRAFWPALSVGLGLLLCFWHYKDFLIGNQHLFVLKHIANPGMYLGDPELTSLMRVGFYHFSPKIFGSVLGLLGLAPRLMDVLEGLQLLLWGIQILSMYLLTRRLTGNRWSAVLASCLFAWQTPFFRVADTPYFPPIAFGRSLGLTATLPAVVLYFSGRKWAAWLLAAGSLYLHGIPGVYALEMFILADLFESWRDKKVLKALVLRLAATAVILSPIFLSQIGLGRIPEHYAFFSLIGIKAYPPIPRFHPTDWILFFQGIAFIAAAWRGFRATAAAPACMRVFWACAVMAVVMVLSRAGYPLGLPFGEFLMKVSSPFSFLFLAEILGLVLVSHWTVDRWQRDPGWAFPLLTALAAFVASHHHDYLLRFLALGIWLCAWAGRRGLAPAVGLSAGALGLCALWYLNSPAIKVLLLSGLGLRGGLFSLPAFHWTTPALLSAALALAALVRRRAAKETLPVTVLMVLLSAALTRGIVQERPNESLDETLSWIRSQTPKDSLILLPRRGGPTFFDFMIRCERAAFATDNRYAVMLYEHGPSALPIAERLEDLGVDPSCCRLDDEMRRELDRAYDELDFARIESLVRKYGLTHWLVREPWNPTPERESIYKNGPYRLYAAGPRGAPGD